MNSAFKHLSRFWSEERNLTVLLGIVVFDYFILSSLTSGLGERPVISILNNLVFSLLLMAGVFALTRYKLIQGIVAVIVALIILVRWARLIFGGTWLGGWDIFFSLLSSIAFVVVVLGHVFKEGPMTSHRIQGATAAYLLIAMAFALAYFLLEFMSPGSFHFLGGSISLDSQSWRVFYYFSITTLTTTGYGDITPIHPIARNLAMAEALVGQLYPAILLARLVTLHTQTRQSK
jgi:hypothetical protein